MPNFSKNKQEMSQSDHVILKLTFQTRSELDVLTDIYFILMMNATYFKPAITDKYST